MGELTPDHPVHEDLKRVRTYLEKLEQRIRISKGPNLKVDASASKRMVQHALVQPKDVEKRKEALLQDDSSIIVQQGKKKRHHRK
jgi:hypothetical protein